MLELGNGDHVGPPRPSQYCKHSRMADVRLARNFPHRSVANGCREPLAEPARVIHRDWAGDLAAWPTASTEVGVRRAEARLPRTHDQESTGRPRHTYAGFFPVFLPTAATVFKPAAGVAGT